MSAVTYPCVVRGRIVELTAEQKAQHEASSLPAAERIAALERRVAELERLVRRLCPDRSEDL